MDRVEGYTINATKVRDGDDIKEMTYDSTSASILSQILDQLKILNARMNAGVKTQVLGVGITVPGVVTL